LQGAATWWFHCHDSTATCIFWRNQWHCKNSIRLLKIVFRHIFICFLMHFELWKAAAFVSPPLHLFKLAILYAFWRQTDKRILVNKDV